MLMPPAWRTTTADKVCPELGLGNKLVDYHLDPKFPDNIISKSLMAIMLFLICMNN